MSYGRKSLNACMHKAHKAVQSSKVTGSDFQVSVQIHNAILSATFTKHLKSMFKCWEEQSSTKYSRKNLIYLINACTKV